MRLLREHGRNGPGLPSLPNADRSGHAGDDSSLPAARACLELDRLTRLIMHAAIIKYPRAFRTAKVANMSAVVRFGQGDAILIAYGLGTRRNDLELADRRDAATTWVAARAADLWARSTG